MMILAQMSTPQQQAAAVLSNDEGMGVSLFAIFNNDAKTIE